MTTIKERLLIIANSTNSFEAVAEQCEKIVEEIGIEFMVWSRNSFDAKSYLSAKELYKIFKAENGL